jgi:hypothetical protein
MTFITRFCIALAISALVPAFFINYSRQSALQTELEFTYCLFWLIMTAISWYTSPTSASADASSSTLPPFARVAALRTRIGKCALIVSAAIYFPYVFFASYAFALKYETKIFMPLSFIFGLGMYLYGTVMCPSCRKLNQLSSRRCENCGIPLPANFFQTTRDDAED